jgi:hypothetical protein
VVAPEHPAGYRQPAGRLPIALGLACLASVTAAIAVALPASSPLSPDHAGGEPTYAQAYLGAMFLAVACYWAGVAVVRRRPVSRRAVVAIAIVVQTVPLAGPVLLSTDVYTYWAYGRIAAVHGGNPYAHPPDAFPHDVAYDRMGADWRDTTSVYGPVFTLASEAHAAAVGRSPRAAELVYRVAAAAAAVVVTVLAASLAASPPLAAALVGWNPLLAVHLAGGGHNDALLAALMLTALWLARRRMLDAAGAAWAVAAAVKWIPLVVLALRAVEARRTGRRVSHLGFAATAAAVAGAATWRYGGDWLGAFGPLARNLAGQTSYSLPHRLSQAGLPEHAASGVLAFALAVGLVLLVRQAWRGRARLALAVALLLLTTPWLVAWYLVWLVALAAVDDDRLARTIALALTAYLVPQAVPL